MFDVPSHIAFDPILREYLPDFGTYLLVIGVALALLALLALGPSSGRLSRRQRAALLALRAGVIVLVVLAMLRPEWRYTEPEKQPATLVVLIDESRSMSVCDAGSGRSRWEALRRALDAAAPALAKLDKQFELKVYTFDVQSRRVKVDAGKVPLPETPEGLQTAIGAALDDVLQQEAGKRLLGVILAGDGAQRARPPRDLPPQTAVEPLKHSGYPLFAFVFGESRGAGQTKDVAVIDLPLSEIVYEKNELVIKGHVQVDGYRGCKVRVLFETSPGKMEPIDKVKELQLDDKAGSQTFPVEFSYIPQTAGEFKVTLEAEPQPGELVVTNNQLSTFVNVLKGGVSVLYIEGGLRVEQKFIRRALDASPDIKVDYLRIDPRDSKTRPDDMAERFKPGKYRYDVYILGDLDSIAFKGTELEDLKEAVAKGAGLIMLGGFHSFGPGGYFNTPLDKVLPVAMDRLERQNLDEAIRSDLHLPGPLRMQPTRLGLMSFALMLAPAREQNEALWKKLPPLEGANRFRGLTSDRAVVLINDGQDHPLLVTHNYADGRVLAFAGDSTWHWWLEGYAAVHKRFWRQVVLWLAKKDLSTEGNVWIKLEKPSRRFMPTEIVEFTAGANAANREPIKDADYDVQIVLPDGTRRPLTTSRQGEQVSGSFPDTQAAGDYAIEVTATHAGDPLGSTRARFLVYEQDLELDNAAANADLLQSLAAMTQGDTLPPDALPELIELLTDRRPPPAGRFPKLPPKLVERLTQQAESLSVRQIPKKKTLWDKWSFFLTLVSLLGAEWYLRKRWGLV